MLPSVLPLCGAEILLPLGMEALVFEGAADDEDAPTVRPSPWKFLEDEVLPKQLPITIVRGVAVVWWKVVGSI